MSFSVIVSQGRVADRTNGALVGARLTGVAVGALLGVEPAFVGAPTLAENDDWTESLPAAADTLAGLRAALQGALDAGHAPILATNTCAASLATLPEVAARYPDAVLLWIDAHGDFNTPATTGSGYLGGMVLAAACGLWDSGHGAGLNPQQVWIHVDWDVLEPGYIPAAYKIAEGLLPHQVGEIFSALPAGAVRGVELAEFEAGEEETAGVPERVSLELILETFQQLRWE